MHMDTELLKFLKEQRVFALGTSDKDGVSWISNAFYSINGKGQIFFISDPKAKHSINIEQQKNVSFNMCWVDPKDMWHRKAIQGSGTCEQLSNPLTIGKCIVNHFKFFPTWKEWMSKKDMVEKLLETRPYLITPIYVKFWNDELYGEDGTREFKL